MERLTVFEDEPQCVICAKVASMYSYEVLGGRVEEKQLCVSHATEFIAEHQREFGDPTARSHVCVTESKKVECFVHFLFAYPKYDPPYGYVELRESAGSRVFGFTVDLYVCAELNRSLIRFPMHRPHGPDTILEVIRRLGASLSAVDIYQLTGADGTFGSMARIVRDGKELSVDMRASDAIVLALLDTKPVFVPEYLLVSASGSIK